MQTIDTFTPQELNAIIRTMPPDVVFGPFPAPKKWRRVDVCQTEVYVGDRDYVVALVDKLPETVDDLAKNQVNTEETIVKYLQEEGFIGIEYAYVGMQKFDLQHPPKGLLDAEED